MRNLKELLLASPDDRDLQWEDEFLTQLSSSKVAVLSPDPQTGPDQWPYLLVGTNPASNQGEDVQKILAWLAERGIGLVVNPASEYPDFVLTYGMIWNFRETGRFIDRRQASSVRPGGSDPESEGEIEYSRERLKMAGPPTDQYLPLYVRKILRQFLHDQGILKPRVQVLSLDGTHFDLALSLESLGNPPEAEHAGIAEALSWFLPLHYSIVLISEKGLPPFTDL